MFVPDYRQIKVSDLREGMAPGMALNTDPIWHVPLLTFMIFGAVGPMLGAAEAMFELVSDVLAKKTGAYTGAKLQQQMSTRIRLASNKMQLDATRGLFDEKIRVVDDAVTAGDKLTPDQRAEMRFAVAHIAKTSHALVNDLAQAAGSRAYFLDSPIQRFQRDVNSLATHAIFDYDSLGNLYGGVLMGQGVPPGSMI